MMKRLLAIFAFVLLGAIRVGAVGNCVNTWGANDAAGSATTITVSVTPTGGTGHMLIAAARDGTSNSTAITFGDNSGSNSWNNLATASYNNGQAAQGWAANIVAGTYTITATLQSSTNRAITVCELASMATSSQLDTGPTPTACNTGAGSCTSNTFTTTNANDVIIVMATTGFSPTYVAGLIGGVSSTLETSNSNDFGVETLIVSSTQSGITAAMSAMSGTGNWILTIGAYKQAPGGVGGVAIAGPTVTAGPAVRQ